MVKCFENHDAFLVHLLEVYDAGIAEWVKVHGGKDRCPAMPQIRPQTA